jgi:hypothetical protein
MEQAPEISLRRRIWFWIGAWGIATVATVGLSPGLLLFAWLFPVGLLNFAPAGWDSSPPSDPSAGVDSMIVLGWLLYIALTIVGLSQSRRTRYFVIFGILCVLLALNVVGCRFEQKQPMHT